MYLWVFWTNYTLFSVYIILLVGTMRGHSASAMAFLLPPKPSSAMPSSAMPEKQQLPVLERDVTTSLYLLPHGGRPLDKDVVLQRIRHRRHMFHSSLTPQSPSLPLLRKDIEAGNDAPADDIWLETDAFSTPWSICITTYTYFMHAYNKSGELAT